MTTKTPEEQGKAWYSREMEMNKWDYLDETGDGELVSINTDELAIRGFCAGHEAGRADALANQTEFRALLKRYMEHVGVCEGTDFLGVKVSFLGVLSKEDIKILRAISAEELELKLPEKE